MIKKIIANKGTHIYILEDKWSLIKTDTLLFKDMSLVYQSDKEPYFFMYEYSEYAFQKVLRTAEKLSLIDVINDWEGLMLRILPSSDDYRLLSDLKEKVRKNDS